LTPLAEHGGAARDRCDAERRGADWAGKPRPTVHPVQRLKLARAIVGIYVVAKARTAAGDRLPQGELDGFRELRDLAEGQRTGRVFRMDPRAMEGLVGVDVSHSGNDGLIEGRLHRPALGRPDRRRDVRWRSLETVGTELLPPGAERRLIGKGPQSSESPGVSKHHPLRFRPNSSIGLTGPSGPSGTSGTSGTRISRVDEPHSVSVRCLLDRPGCGSLDQHLAGHPKVDHQATAVISDESHLLAVSFNRRDPPAFEKAIAQRLPFAIRSRIEHVTSAKGSADDACTDEGNGQ